MQPPLQGLLVVDLTRYLPGAFAGRELLRLGARVVRVEQPGGEPMRQTAPEWHDELNAGKESVVAELPADAAFVRALLARAAVVLESFRPGVAARLGVGPEAVSPSCVYCSITGFGVDNEHERRVGHDLNYLGWAGVLEPTLAALPPVQAADLAAGALGAVTEILARLVAREGGHVVVSMTHNAYALRSLAPVLTDGHACYSIYETADGRLLTVGALEPKFFARLCELLALPELAERQYDEEQALLRDALAAAFRRRTLADWLAVFRGEDVCVGPVATRAEATAFAPASLGAPPALGAHTAAWREELGA
jgi:crotonobetainyl-CoA:carnitine CoA-transferase CaiB-like acyl-CoA transferase